MTKRTYLSAISSALIAALLSACGGGGATTSLPSTGSSGGGKTPNVAMTFHFNVNSGTNARRKPLYTSRATKGLSLSWKADGTGTFPATESAMASSSTFVTATTPNTTTPNETCTVADPSGAFSCTVLLPIAPGYEDFQITTWDQAPATLGGSGNGFGGTFAASANDLSTNVIMNQRIVGNQTNTFNFTLNGVVSSVALTILPNSLISGGGAQTATLQVLAEDADGNIIIGNDPFVDVNGNPVTLTLSKTGETYPSPLVGPVAPPAGDVTFDAGDANCAGLLPTCTFTSANPAGNTDIVDYNGYEISTATFTLAVITTGPAIASSTQTIGFTNSVNGPIVIPGSPTMLSLALGNSSTGADAIAGGGFGQQYLYVADSSNNRVDQILTGSSPSVNASWSIGLSPNNVAVGADNNVFMTLVGGNLGILDPTSSTVETYAPPSGSAGGGITAGPDNNVYFTYYGFPGRIGEMLVVGQSVGAGGFCPSSCPFPVSATQATSAGTNQITQGPSGSNTLWFTETGAPGVDDIGWVSAGLASAPTEYGISGAVSLDGIVLGSDGNIYATDTGAQMIYQVCAQAACGASSEGAVLNSWSTAPYSPYGIARGLSNDLYVAERGTGLAGASNAIARLVPSAPAAQQLVVYTNGVPTGNTQPDGVALGADGHIYFTQAAAGNVGYFTP